MGEQSIYFFNSNILMVLIVRSKAVLIFCNRRELEWESQYEMQFILLLKKILCFFSNAEGQMIKNQKIWIIGSNASMPLN